MGETYTSQTNSKIAQDREWRKYFDFEIIKGTQKIRITEIYEHKKLDFSVKGGSMPKILDPAVFLCLAKKYTESTEQQYVTISGLATEVGICSQFVTKFYNSDSIYHELKKKYSSSSNDKNNESKVFKIMAGYVQKAQSSYKSMIGSALDRLEKEHLITVEEVMLINNKKLNYRICRLIEQEQYEEIKKLVIPPIYDKIQDNIISKDEKNEAYFKEAELCKIGITDDELREASAEEKRFIEKVRNEVLKDFECATMQELYNKNARNPAQIRKYFNECKKRCAEFNIDSFEAYRIDWCSME